MLLKKYGHTALHRISFLRKNEQRHKKKTVFTIFYIRYIDYHLTKLFPNVNPAPKDENSSKSSLLNLLCCISSEIAIGIDAEEQLACLSTVIIVCSSNNPICAFIEFNIHLLA